MPALTPQARPGAMPGIGIEIPHVALDSTRPQLSSLILQPLFHPEPMSRSRVKISQKSLNMITKKRTMRIVALSDHMESTSSNSSCSCNQILHQDMFSLESNGFIPVTIVSPTVHSSRAKLRV